MKAPETSANSSAPTAGGPATIPLKHPVTTAEGKRIESLNIRRPKRKDIKAAQKFSKDEVDQEDFLFARLTGLTIEDLDELDAQDSAALQDSFRSMVGG